MSVLTQFLGGSPFRVLLKLIVASFIVGVAMSAFGWSPLDVIYAIEDMLARLWNMGFSAFDRFLGYFLLGAAIVVPAFVVLRLLSFRNPRDRRDTEK